MAIVVVVLLLLASAGLFVFAAHVDALSGRIGRQPARKWRERLRRHGGRLRSTPWRGWLAAGAAQRPAASTSGK